MIPASFEYFAPTSVDDAIALLQEHGDEAKVLAGGHSLIPMMKLRLSEPGVLVDIGGIGELRGIRRSNGSVAIGALTTYTAIGGADELRGAEALTEAALSVGDAQVRNRGTIGGSLAHADPGADLPAAVLALDAEIALKGPNGERSVRADEFFQGFFTSDIGEAEILTEIRLAQPPARTGTAYVKFPNPASGYAVVGVAARVTLDEDGRVADARVAITGAGDHAVRATAVEDALRGQQLTDEVIATAAANAPEGIDPLDDIHASAEYRAELARVYTRRALVKARERAGR
jgi:aerobic carbon-monoxide dehydrogenase medium subunit